MNGFFLAILCNFVLKYISLGICHRIVMTRTEEQRAKSGLFQFFAVFYMLNHGMFYINATVIIAYFLSKYL